MCHLGLPSYCDLASEEDYIVQDNLILFAAVGRYDSTTQLRNP